MLLVAGIGFAAAAPRNRPPGRRPWDRRSGEIRAKRLVLVDDAGKPRAVLGSATRGAVSLGLLDNDDKIRAVLIVDANGIPRLDLFGSDETRRMVLSVFPNRSGLAG